MFRHGPFLRRLSRDRFAGFTGTMTVLRLPAVLPKGFVAFAFWCHRTRLFFVSPDGSGGIDFRPAGCSRSVLRRLTLAGEFYDGTTRGSQVPGESVLCLCHAQETPVAPSCHAICGNPVLPPLS